MEKTFILNMGSSLNYMDRNFVNICMTTYNRLDFTKKAIDSILDKTSFPHVLTVVDNHSEDETVPYLKDLYSKKIIKNLILLDENVGVAKASNLAWQMEDTKYYMKYDNDIIVTKPNWLAPMIEILDNTSKIAMIGYTTQHWNRDPFDLEGYRVRSVELNLGGACVVIPEKTKERFGYWCEDYGLYAEEDMDYGLRISNGGLLSVYMEDDKLAEQIDHAKEIQDDPEYKSYFHWKHLQRQEALPILGKNIKKYKNDKNSLYINTSMNPEDFKDNIYKEDE